MLFCGNCQDFVKGESLNDMDAVGTRDTALMMGPVAQPAAALRASPLAKNDPISVAHRGLAKR
jgi:hypothetical protein